MILKLEKEIRNVKPIFFLKIIIDLTYNCFSWQSRNELEIKGEPYMI